MPPGVKRLAVALAGPTLIVISVLVVLHDFAFGGKISSQHVDLLAYSLPLQCFMGRSLAAGHIPAWNPYSMAGAPSAADPQSGWTYLPAMLLYSVLPCGLAMRWFIVVQPIIAGVGLYLFLRSEGLSRVVATAGGVVLALVGAGALIAVYLPFIAIVAWIPLLLAAVSRCLQAPSWPARLAWAAMTALMWGQLGAAFLGTGFALGLAALLFYGAGRTWIEVSARRLSGRNAALLWAAVLISLPLVNLAYLVPRLAYFPHTSISMGYDKLQQVGAQLAGISRQVRPIGSALRQPWPLKFATAPGTYFGGVALLFTFAGWWSKRHRLVVAALSAFGVVSYLLTLRTVARALLPRLQSVSLADPYLHGPLRFGYGIFPIIAALSAFGLEAWRKAGSWRSRALMVLPGLAVWGLLPIRQGVPLSSLRLLLLGTVVGGAVAVISLRRPAVLLLLPLILAAELGTNDLIGQHRPNLQLPVPGLYGRQLFAPTVDSSAYLRPDRIVNAIRREDDSRILSLAPKLVNHRGYLTHQQPDEWPLEANQRAMLFDLEDVQGYSSFQLRRYWFFVRSMTSLFLDYNSAVFPDPPPVALDLLQVGWIVGPANDPPLPDLTKIETEGRWALYRRSQTPPRASVVGDWTVMSSSTAAREALLQNGFDPERQVILEGDPGVRPSGEPSVGTATYEARGTQAARVFVDAPSPSIILVRNAYDPNWHAKVDGRAAQVLPADYLAQGVPVPAGRHVIDLAYDDPTVGYGLFGSAVALAVLLAPLVVVGVRRRRTNEAPSIAMTTSAEPKTPRPIQGSS
jgi:hypothetical protein